ncbi:MAG: transporter [Acidobacteria bacterium]|nr:transporter [Acidobacteriota bacterium]
MLRIIVLVVTFTIGAAAQELEPRTYSPTPVGMNFLVVSYTYQTGDIFLDPSLPIKDTEVSLNATVIAYNRTFGLVGRSASMLVALPYVWGEASGEVFEQRRSITRSGLADMRLRFAMNILGGPALKPKDFAARKPATTLAASLTVSAPTGQYDPAKLVNIGSNRWSFKPEVGLSHPIDRWYLELYGGVWLFTDNNNFFGGSRLEQKPVGTIQAHASYTFRPRLWLAADATYYTGGRTIVDDVISADLEKNSRFGMTFSLPVGRRYSVKISWARGVATRIGGDFNTVSVAWQYAWFD